jgi:hypothetical protein
VSFAKSPLKSVRAAWIKDSIVAHHLSLIRTVPQYVIIKYRFDGGLVKLLSKKMSSDYYKYIIRIRSLTRKKFAGCY